MTFTPTKLILNVSLNFSLPTQTSNPLRKILHNFIHQIKILKIHKADTVLLMEAPTSNLYVCVFSSATDQYQNEKRQNCTLSSTNFFNKCLPVFCINSYPLRPRFLIWCIYCGSCSVRRRYFSLFNIYSWRAFIRWFICRSFVLVKHNYADTESNGKSK